MQRINPIGPSPESKDNFEKIRSLGSQREFKLPDHLKEGVSSALKPVPDRKEDVIAWLDVDLKDAIEEEWRKTPLDPKSLIAMGKDLKNILAKEGARDRIGQINYLGCDGKELLRNIDEFFSKLEKYEKSDPTQQSKMQEDMGYALSKILDGLPQ